MLANQHRIRPLRRQRQPVLNQHLNLTQARTGQLA
jgi:hypothetical protein